MENLIPTLLLLGATQGGFLAAALLINSSGEQRANRYLAGYVFVMTLALLSYYLEALGLLASRGWLDSLLWPKEFFYGVFLYLYCHTLTRPNTPLSRKVLAALWLPPLLHVVVTWSLLRFPSEVQYAILGSGVMPAGESLEESAMFWHRLFNQVEPPITMLHVALMLVLSLRLVNQHQHDILESFSYRERISLDWLRYLLMGTFTLLIIWIGGVLIDAATGIGDFWPDSLLQLGMVVLIYTLGWIGLRQPAIFPGKGGASPAEWDSDRTANKARDSAPDSVPDSVPGSGSGSGSGSVSVSVSEADTDTDTDTDTAADSTTPLCSKEERNKYQRSALSPALARSLIEELEALMEREQRHLDAGLSLSSLAESLSVSTNYLSQAINQQSGKSFFDFVNAYRVRHATILLVDTRDPVIDVAMQSGFNSKSAFYTAFRKHQGMTPGEYRKRAADSAVSD